MDKTVRNGKRFSHILGASIGPSLEGVFSMSGTFRGDPCGISGQAVEIPIRRTTLRSRKRGDWRIVDVSLTLRFSRCPRGRVS